ncbi:hypothetical protein Misp05_58980 [Micromonospora sp. NBRC 107095]|nr:hypothetical protein Misp05_58980 [Micromonospora sp. NBRC 107095]
MPLDAVHGRSGHPAAPTLLPLDLPPGAALVLHTDGLVQRRNELIDTGIERVVLPVMFSVWA